MYIKKYNHKAFLKLRFLGLLNLAPALLIGLRGRQRDHAAGRTLAVE
jgi:hypothetical protein